MTLKLIDLFETKFIGEQNIEYIELFKNIEVHPILNIIPEIRKQFILLVSIYHNNLFVINIFKKLYKNKEWKLDKTTPIPQHEDRSHRFATAHSHTEALNGTPRLLGSFQR